MPRQPLFWGKGLWLMTPKSWVITAIMAIFCLANATAENYPYRSDFLWVTNPDHQDWLYKTGEKASVEVQLYRYGIAVDGELDYEIAPDMLASEQKGNTKLKNGRATINIGTRKTPGFIDLKLSSTVAGQKTTHHVKVGFDVEKITPFTKMPADFKDFWDATVAESRKTPISVTRELVKEYCSDKIDCWLIKLRIDKEHYMYGYLTMPKDAEGKKLPVVFCPPGAGIKTIADPLKRVYYAENGMIRLEMEIHGLDPRLSATTWKEINSAFGTRDYGYLNNNLEDRDRYYMRHVYAGMVRCIDYLTTLPEWDGKNIAVQGGSQGGALALITAGLDNRVTLCVANHPALTDMAGYSEKGRTGGYPHFKAMPQGVLTPKAISNLQYYDVVNFCRLITCPVRMTWGYNDNTCPPTTSYAAWNTLTCEKEAFITPINEHWTSATMERQHMEWIKARLK